MEDLYNKAFDSFWEMSEPKKRPISRVPRVTYNQKIQYNKNRLRIQKQNRIAQARTNKLLLTIASKAARTGGQVLQKAGKKSKNIVQSTNVYKKYDINREKNKIWQGYKTLKAKEAREAELKAYKKKLYG